MSEEKLAQAESVGLHKVFKLQSTLTCNSMVLFDHMGCMKRYDSVQDILKEFFDLRLQYYKLRKDWLLGSLGAEASKLSNQARFVLEKIEGKSPSNKSKRELIRMLVQKGFESDPVAAWNKAQEKAQEVEEARDGNESDGSVDSGSGPAFNYILNMPLWCLSKEKVEDLLKQRDHKRSELNDLDKKSPEDLWKEDLAVFIEELDASYFFLLPPKVEQQEREDDNIGKGVKMVKGKVGKPKAKKLNLEETLPSLYGRRVEPPTQALRSDSAKKLSRKKKVDDSSVKMEFDEDGLGVEAGAAGAAENSAVVPKPKTPRVRKDKKEPGTPRVRKTPAPKGTAGRR
ncbi:hypothetical protein KUCAC02_025075 [Chaenocephalus aceratus]|nr:hypothetical protein KUCAC02_025075 [Chaenocephalus aceratus]